MVEYSPILVRQMTLAKGQIHYLWAARRYVPLRPLGHSLIINKNMLPQLKKFVYLFVFIYILLHCISGKVEIFAMYI